MWGRPGAPAGAECARVLGTRQAHLFVGSVQKPNVHCTPCACVLGTRYLCGFHLFCDCLATVARLLCLHFGPLPPCVVSAICTAMLLAWQESELGYGGGFGVARFSPEVMFIHGGHAANINDFAWHVHPTRPWCIGRAQIIARVKPHAHAGFLVSSFFGCRQHCPGCFVLAVVRGV